MRSGLILDRVRPNQQVDNNQNSSLRIPIKLRFSNYILKDNLHLRVVQWKKFIRNHCHKRKRNQ